jgi:hypothetical protein
VPTTAVADGQRRLEVIVEDAAGTPAHVLDRTITVRNTPLRWTSSVTITLGGGAKTPQPGPGPGGPGPGPGGQKGCAAPRLSMFLASKPMRLRRGVPVLVRGRKYRFLGRLTCLIDGRRRPAPRGTFVGIRNRVRGKTVVRAAVKVRGDGRIVARLVHRRSCVVVFRVRAANGRLVTVRIRIRVVSARKARR